MTIEMRVPGDKSITHRALMLAAMGKGTSWIGGALTSLDAKSTARVLRALGAEVSPLRPDATVQVTGRGRFRRPERVLDCGNSGTTSRLLLGLLAAHRFRATLTGDRSLRRRPMRRVTEPLTRMGATFEGADPDRLPLTVRGGPLRPLARYEMPVSSAQVKSAILLAGLAGGVRVELREPTGRSRDHTERMLRAFGYRVSEDRYGWIRFRPDGRIEPFAMQVPGDASSAAFLVAAGILGRGEVRLLRVGVNPTRTGFLDVLARMGAPVEQAEPDEEMGEPVADLIARPAELVSTEVEAREIPGLIDEIPMLAVLATRARGSTWFRRVGELRVKESDRLGLLAENIRAVGGRAEVWEDDLVVEGTDAPPRGRVRTDGDHRLSMAFQVLGTVPGARITVDDPECAAVSFPGFAQTLAALRPRRRV